MLQRVSAMCSFMSRFLIFLLFRLDCWLPWGICKHRRPVGLPQTLAGGSFSISVLLHFHCCKEILWPRPLLEGPVYCGITIPDSDSLWWSCWEYGSRKVVMALAIPRYLGLRRDTVRKHQKCADQWAWWVAHACYTNSVPTYKLAQRFFPALLLLFL